MKSSFQKKPVFRLAFCSVIAALETVLMLLTGLTRIGTYAIPAFAGMLTVAVVIEYRCKWALGVFAVTSVLAALLAGDKEAVVMFIALFGYYPILKNVLERYFRGNILRWVLKFAVFNAAAVASFYVATLLLSVPASEFTLFGVYLPHVFLLAGNVVFLLYDMSIAVFVRFYAQRLHPILFGKQ